MDSEKTFEKLSFSMDCLTVRKPQKGIHSYAHQVVKEVCDYLEVKEFGLWLGVAKRIGVGELKAKLGYVMDKGIKNSHYLLATCKNKKI